MQISNFMEIRSVGAELFYANGGSRGSTDTMKLHEILRTPLKSQCPSERHFYQYKAVYSTGHSSNQYATSINTKRFTAPDTPLISTSLLSIQSSLQHRTLLYSVRPFYQYKAVYSTGHSSNQYVPSINTKRFTTPDAPLISTSLLSIQSGLQHRTLL